MKNSSFELSQSARLDLLQLWNYFAEIASLDVADRMRDDIEKAIISLVAMPRIGHRRTDLTTDPSLLFFTVHSYFIIYKSDSSPLKIARILHASRDIASALEN